MGTGGASTGGTTATGGSSPVTCSSGFTSCDSQPDCETDIRQASHCGGCTTVCSGGTPACTASGSTYVCTSGCSGADVRCSGVCTDTKSDVANCNGCGKPCTIANGTPNCTSGTCMPASCSQGYSACGNVCIFTDGDPNNCGGCNLKCPSGSLCKTGMCEVRVGYPDRFPGDVTKDFWDIAGDYAVAFPLQVTVKSNLLALGYINTSTPAGEIATFALYDDLGGIPTNLVVAAAGTTVRPSVQEVAVTPTFLSPGTYHFAIQAAQREPKISTSTSSKLDFVINGQQYVSGLPIPFNPGFFGIGATPNVYLVVRQPGS